MTSRRLPNATVPTMSTSPDEHRARSARTLWVCAAAVAIVAAGCNDEPSGSADPPADSGLTMLEEVAAIVIPNCAIGGCHDSVSETHSMDLSTAEKIYDFWVGQPGYDHCTHAEVPRVLPWNPDGSLVVIKITGVERLRPVGTYASSAAAEAGRGAD